MLKHNLPIDVDERLTPDEERSDEHELGERDRRRSTSG